MSLQAQQIVNLALQIAKAPGYTSQAGQMLNAILSELCQTYDLVVTRKNYNFQFNTTTTDALGYQPGCGPNVMPADYLRAPRKGHFFNIFGTIYQMINVEQAEFDAFVQSPGNQAYPSMFYVDMSQAPPALYVYWPAGGAYAATVRYYSQMPDITNPETSATVPWFPNTNYLVRRLAGEMMMLTDDDRAPAYLSAEEESFPNGAGVILRRYLTMQDDPEGRVKRVHLDRRFFKGPTQLKNTKIVGWILAGIAVLPPLLQCISSGVG
jgi:hypothetical protein